MSRPPGLIPFSDLAGAPLHYARTKRHPYGTIGKGPRTCYLIPETHDRLQLCFSELWELCRWGKAEAVVTAGAWVDKPGRHGEGRAFDIDSIWWLDEHPLIAMRAPDDARRYLGVEAILRRHFGTVLGWWYNAQHKGHWHIDDGSPVGWFPKSRSRTVFLQAALTHVWGLETEIDGQCGPQTLGNASALLGRLGLSDGLEVDWGQVLLETGWKGLSGQVVGAG